MSNPINSLPTQDTEALNHRIRDLELLCDEYRARIKRLANQTAYYARLCKQLTKKEIQND